MTTETNGKNEERLLTTAERGLLRQIAGGEPPDSQRAQALLAIDEGATQSAASNLSGLTLGQVRYWLGRFRAQRASIFPPEALARAQVEDPHSLQTEPKPLASTNEPEADEVAAAEEVQEEMVVTAEADVQPAPLQDTPTAGKKPKKKRKEQKRAKKEKKEKKSKKKDKKPKKKRSKKGKKGKKGKKSKEKGSKGKSGKKKGKK